MSDVTIKAIAWTEKTLYIECPVCLFVECFGEGAMLCEKTWACERCKREFEIDDHTEWRFIEKI